MGPTVLSGNRTIICELKTRSRRRAVAELVARIPGLDNSGARSELVRDVLARTRSEVPAVGNGVAVIHGKSPALTGISVVIGIAGPGIAFEAADRRPVRLIFLIVNHPDRQLDYLLTLSAVVRAMRDRSYRDRLVGAWLRDPDQVGTELAKRLETAIHRPGFPSSSESPP